MANNITALNYANTFGDWVNTTNYLSTEMNTLGKGIYTKDTGTLVLNGTGEVLRSNGNVNIYYSTFQVVGTGSSAYIQNGLSVGGNLIVSGNTVLQNNLSIYSNTITLSANVSSSNVSNNYITVYRGGIAANSAQIRWNESGKFWDLYDVNSKTYDRILTSNVYSGVASGYYGSSTQIPVIGIDVTGRIVTANSVGISTTTVLGGTSGSGFFTGGGYLNFAGDYGVTAAISSSNTVTIATPQDLRTSANVTFNNIIATGNVSAVNGNFSGGVTGASGTFGPIIGTTGTFSGAVTFAGQGTFSNIVAPSANINGQVFATSPNSGTSGAVVLRDAPGNPNSVYLQAVNNAISAQYGYIKFNNTGSIQFSGPLILPNNVWMNSAEGYNRFYFGSSDATYIRGVSSGGTPSWYIRLGDQSSDTRSIFTGGGDFYTNGNVTAYWSDRRLKKNINKITDWRDIINGLNGYRYEWNDLGRKILDDSDTEGGVKVGLIAQEVQSVLPQAAAVQMMQYKDNKNGVLIPKDDINYDPENPYLTVKEEKLIPVLVEAVKGLMEEIEELRKEIQDLKKA
jgi:hypothetical protein